MKMITISEYVNSLNENGGKAVIKFIDFMNAEFPDIEPAISYGMPMWKFGAKLYDGYVAISAAKGHFSVHFYDEARISDLSELLPGCTFGKRCVSIKYGDENSTARVMQSVKEYVIKSFASLGR
ncbi:MAG: DUF1801 domain-containing protein [Methanomassiliicoccaceae archaeon]|nr:DUF1801 domain-containing protein [Methanomassiliicoccaceae archaeon]